MAVSRGTDVTAGQQPSVARPAINDAITPASRQSTSSGSAWEPLKTDLASADGSPGHGVDLCSLAHAGDRHTLSDKRFEIASSDPAAGNDGMMCTPPPAVAAVAKKRRRQETMRLLSRAEDFAAPLAGPEDHSAAIAHFVNVAPPALRARWITLRNQPLSRNPIVLVHRGAGQQQNAHAPCRSPLRVWPRFPTRRCLQGSAARCRRRAAIQRLGLRVP